MGDEIRRKRDCVAHAPLARLTTSGGDIALVRMRMAVSVSENTVRCLRESFQRRGEPTGEGSSGAAEPKIVS